MKSMSCKDMGGSCDEMVHGATAEEMAMNGMKHVETAHPEMATQIKAMTKEETDKWMAEFGEKYNALG